MVIPEAVAQAGGTQSDAAVTENTGRSFWCHKYTQRGGRSRVPRHGTSWRTFHIVGGQWVGQKPPQPKPTHLQAARTPVHEDGGRDHDAPVVTAEKVVIARQKARALTVSSRML